MDPCQLNSIEPVKRRWPQRPGFTLIELLVAISIMAILAALTFTMLNVTMDNDRIGSASREVQSFLEGARNQASYAKAPRGVRFLLNPNDPTTVNSMIYIGPPSTLTGNFETFLNSPVLGNVGAPVTQTDLTNLARRGLLANGARIRIPRTGTDAFWYTIAFNNVTSNWELTKPYEGLTPGPQQFELELSPAVLPNQEPRLLARNVVIDLDNSLLPASWGSGAPYSPQMDILFSPKGSVIGAVGATGRIHFALADVTDTNNNITARTPTGMTVTSTSALYPQWAANHDFSVGDWVVPDPSAYIAYRVVSDSGTAGAGAPAWPTDIGATVVDQDLTWQCFSKKPNLIVSLSTQTGSAASYPADVTQRTPGFPPDPFYFAVTGEVAK